MMVLVSDWTQGPGVCSLLSGLSHNKELPPCEPGLGKTEVRTYITYAVLDGMEWNDECFTWLQSGAAHAIVCQENRGGVRQGRTNRVDDALIPPLYRNVT